MIILKNNAEEVKCSECPIIFKRRVEGSRASRLPKGIKKAGTKTCSKECSKIRWEKKRKEVSKNQWIRRKEKKLAS